MKFSKHFKKLFELALVAVAISLLQSCRPRSESHVADTAVSPADFSQPSGVIWLTSDNNVHVGECPVGTATVNRNCTGLTETVAVVTLDKFKEKLKNTIITSRPNAPASGSITPDEAKAKLIDTKIKRLNDKISSNQH